MAKSCSVILITADPSVSTVISRVDPSAAECFAFFSVWTPPCFVHAVIPSSLSVRAIACAGISCPVQNDWTDLIVMLGWQTWLGIWWYSLRGKVFVISSAHEVVPELVTVPPFVWVVFAESGDHFSTASVGLHIIVHYVLAFAALKTIVFNATKERDGCTIHAFTPPVLGQACCDFVPLEVFLGEQLATVIVNVLSNCNCSNQWDGRNEIVHPVCLTDCFPKN